LSVTFLTLNNCPETAESSLVQAKINKVRPQGSRFDNQSINQSINQSTNEAITLEMK